MDQKNNNQDKKDLINKEAKVFTDSITRVDVLSILQLLLQIYFFNSFVQAVMVFSYRILQSGSELVPVVSVTYGIMIFLFILNFGRFYSFIGSKDISEKYELLKTSFISLIIILFLNILAELLISRIPY